MKRIAFGFIFLSAILLLSCNKQARKADYTEDKAVDVLTCEREIGSDSVFFRYPYRVEVEDGIAVVMDLHNDSHYLYAFSYPEWEPIAPFGRRGEGPDEMLSGDRVRVCSVDSVWVLDANRMQITRWSVDMAKRSVARVEEIPLDKRLLRTLDFCKSEKGFIVTDYTGEYRYHEIGMDGQIQQSIGVIPTRDSTHLENRPALAQAWRTFMDYNSRNGVLAMVTQLGEVLEIYNRKTGFHKVLFGPGGEPVFKSVGGEAIPTGIKGFEDVLVGDSCIYASFDGISFKEMLKAFKEGKDLPDGGKYLYVFSLEGELLHQYTLDHHVFGLELRDNHLFTTSMDNNNPVVEYAL